MAYFWLSWYQPTEDYRPLKFPPNEAVLGWWCSGERCSGGAATLVAEVLAVDEAEAKAVVVKDWPEAREWRFCKESATPHSSDRFPPSDWMTPRYEAAKER